MTRRQRSIVQWTVVGVLTLVGLWLTVVLSQPAPPKRIRFAGGPTPGSYDDVARDLAKRVTEDEGPAVDVLVTAGSVENLALVVAGKADVGLVQSGVVAGGATPEEMTRVRSVARLYSEPLWVFYQASSMASELTLLSQLRAGAGGKRLSIWVGPPGSGTRQISLELLRINGITSKNATLLETERLAAFEAFSRGEIHVLFAVASPTSETVERLIRAPGVKLMSFVNHRAYAKRIPYLGEVEVEQGLLSFEEHLPSQPVVLLAPAATLVVSADLHPRVIEKLTKAAVAKFGGGNLVDLAGEFPSSRNLELPQHPAARRFLEEGESWASQNLPLWLVRALSTLKLALIPLFAFMLPAARLMPLLLSLRSARVIRKRYLVLRDVEDRMRRATTSADVEAQLAENERLRDEVAKLGRDLPARFQNAVYDFRLHANLVRQEGIERLAAIRADGN